MQNSLSLMALIMALLPLAGAILGGIFGKKLGRRLTHRLLILFVGVAFFLACYLFKVMILNAHPFVETNFYTWATAGVSHFDVAFLVDRLSVMM